MQKLSARNYIMRNINRYVVQGRLSQKLLHEILWTQSIHD